MCLKGLYDMELNHNVGMTLFKKLFHMMGANDIWRASSDSFEIVVIPLLLETHV